MVREKFRKEVEIYLIKQDNKSIILKILEAVVGSIIYIFILGFPIFFLIGLTKIGILGIIIWLIIIFRILKNKILFSKH